jgi:hypothetical protein
VNVHLKPSPELERARAEVAEHQRFAALVERRWRFRCRWGGRPLDV